MVNVLSYPNIMEAYRTDQIADIQLEPAEGGNIWGQDGYWAWWSAQPADPTADGVDAGLSTGTMVGIGAVLVLLLGMGTFVILRRRSTVEDRE